MKIISLAKFLLYGLLTVVMTACGVNSDSPDLDSTSTTIPSVESSAKVSWVIGTSY